MCIAMLKIVYFIANLDKYLLQMTDTNTGKETGLVKDHTFRCCKIKKIYHFISLFHYESKKVRRVDIEYKNNIREIDFFARS